MNPFYKKVLYLYLDSRSYEYKVHEDLWKYLGGVGVAYKICDDNKNAELLVLTCGPLNGYFPYVSKACLLYNEAGTIVEKYGGGSIGGKLNMASIDAVVIFGEPDSHLKITIYEDEVTFSSVDLRKKIPTNADFSITDKGVFSLDYHSFSYDTEFSSTYSKNLWIDIKASGSREVSNFYDYESLYQNAIESYQKLTIEPRNNPSCLGCPLGCDNSSMGEDDLNIGVIPRSLVACGYAEEIYKNIPFVYACLSSLGYRYQHKDLEGLPTLVGELKTKVKGDKNE